MYSKRIHNDEIQTAVASTTEISDSKHHSMNYTHQENGLEKRQRDCPNRNCSDVRE